MGHLWNEDLAIACCTITGRSYARYIYLISCFFPSIQPSTPCIYNIPIQFTHTFPTKLDRDIINSDDLAFALVQVDITSALVDACYLDLAAILFSFKSHQFLFKVGLSPVQAVLVNPTTMVGLSMSFIQPNDK